MLKKMLVMGALGAALVLGTSSANEAQAWFGRHGGGSSGSSGGWFSGGSNGGHGGGLFSRWRGSGSNGSSGGAYNGGGSSGGCASDCDSGCGACNSGTSDCGCGGTMNSESYHQGDEASPPAAPRDPGSTGQPPAQPAPSGGASARIEPVPANVCERAARTVLVSRPTRVIGR